MRYDPGRHRRRSIRLQDYDYALPGAYFVTICTHERACLFGVVGDGEMQLNDAGRMIEQWWFELNRKFLMVETDEFVIMPNHFHGIVVITDVPVGADLRVGPVPEGGHYYEHVIRDDQSLNRIRQYILDNPSHWPFDRENPAATAPEPEEAWLA